MSRSIFSMNTAQHNSRIPRDTEQIIKPQHDVNAWRKSAREIAANSIRNVKNKQREYASLNLNSFGQREGGPSGFGEPVKNKGYYGIEPPISYVFKTRPSFANVIKDENVRILGSSRASNIPFSTVPAQKRTFCCPPKKINIR